MKNLYLLLIVIGFGFTSGCTAQEAKYEDVSKERFAGLIKDGDGLLIDLRTPKEYKDGHILGSVNIDYFADGFDREIDKLDKNKTVYIYCASGGRSGLTMKLMKEKGFMKVYHLPVGYDGWSEE